MYLKLNGYDTLNYEINIWIAHEYVDMFTIFLLLMFTTFKIN